MGKKYAPVNQSVSPAFGITDIRGISNRNEFLGIEPEAISVEMIYAIIPAIIPGHICGRTPRFLTIR